MMKHVKIEGNLAELLKKVEMGEVLKAYTEGHEQDTMVRVYKEKGVLVIDFGQGVAEEAEGSTEDDLRWMIDEANEHSKLSRMQFLMDEVYRYIIKNYARLTAIRIADIRIDGATMTEIRQAIDELVIRDVIGLKEDDDIVWWC